MGNYEGLKAAQEQDKHNVYRVDPKTGEIKVVVDDFVEPNGLAFSPDEKKLYVIDTGFTDGPDNPAHIRVFDVDIESGKLSNGKVFAEDFKPGITDGMRCDIDGNVWCTMGWGDPKEDGVRCYSAGRRPARQDPHTGDCRQSVLRRPLQKPALHLRLDLALCGLHRNAGRDEAVTRPGAVQPRATTRAASITSATPANFAPSTTSMRARLNALRSQIARGAGSAMLSRSSTWARPRMRRIILSPPKASESSNSDRRNRRRSGSSAGSSCGEVNKAGDKGLASLACRHSARKRRESRPHRDDLARVSRRDRGHGRAAPPRGLPARNRRARDCRSRRRHRSPSGREGEFRIDDPRVGVVTMIEPECRSPWISAWASVRNW